MLKLIFAGDRRWQDKNEITRVMQLLYSFLGRFVVIEGEANGADLISREVAEKVIGLPVEPFPADWNTYGKAAGPIRNTQMRVEGKADGLLAFHEDLSKSRGTKNMVEQSLKAGLPVWITGQDDEALLEFIGQLKKKQFAEEVVGG